ncbi:MAG: heme-binding domain-containing protein, partial [Oscillochloridaceae bacterium umkhey_bin13]
HAGSPLPIRTVSATIRQRYRLLQQPLLPMKGMIMTASPGSTRRWSAHRLATWALGGLLVIFLGMQLVPYGRDHTNPPVSAEPAWDSPATRALFVRACADCHSNQTVWPWYSNIAPVSWLVTHDVIEGREAFNVSEWGRKAKNEGDDAAETVREGEMPLWFYVPLHPEARFTPAEEQQFIAGLIATFGGEGGEAGRETDDED